MNGRRRSFLASSVSSLKLIFLIMSKSLKPKLQDFEVKMQILNRRKVLDFLVRFRGSTRLVFEEERLGYEGIDY